MKLIAVLDHVPEISEFFGVDAEARIFLLRNVHETSRAGGCPAIRNRAPKENTENKFV
jgi:hypothetical protein